MGSGERLTMKGWGQKLSAEDVPQTLEEAQLTAMIVTSDRLLQIMTTLENLQDRIARLELWIAETSPSYQRSQRNRQAVAALKGVEIR